MKILVKAAKKPGIGLNGCGVDKCKLNCDLKVGEPIS